MTRRKSSKLKSNIEDDDCAVGVVMQGIGDNGDPNVEYVSVSSLVPDADTARRYSRADQLATRRIIRSMGIRLPLLVGPDNVIIWGGHVHAAALTEKIDQIPIIRVNDREVSVRRALSVACNRLGELGSWEREQLGKLMIEFEAEISDIDLGDLGFEVSEIDLALEAAEAEEEPIEELPLLTEAGSPISVVGDLWVMGKHRLLVGDATNAECYHLLMGTRKAHAVFTDPPFGCKIDGFVAGAGRHREFVMASGDMSDEELLEFFRSFLAELSDVLERGAVLYLVIDWRSLQLLMEAARPIFGKLVNLAIWAKDRAAMGSFLRSQHEMVLIYKTAGKMRNNVSLGKHGRHRTNVWQYPSAKTASKGSDEGNMLANHPTPKPVRMVADAILDTTKRGDTVLDPFLGSGTTLIASEKVGRTCFGMELDPHYADLIVRPGKHGRARALFMRTAIRALMNSQSSGVHAQGAMERMLFPAKTRRALKMIKRRKKPGRNYPVGYGKPPSHAQIKPGEVRNPYGRNGKPKTLDDPVERIMMRKRRVTIDRQEVEISNAEAFFMKLLAQAFDGRAGAARILQQEWNQVLQSRPQSPSAVELAEEEKVEAKHEELSKKIIDMLERVAQEKKQRGGD